MLKSYKTEIAPTDEQAEKIRRTIGVCRYVYNLFLATNADRHKNGEKFLSGMDFSKWLNNELVPQNPEKAWIKEVSSKSVKKSIMDAETAYKNFFKGKARFPKFKRKGVNDPKMYFVRTDVKSIIHCERHRIKIPTIGWVRLKEYGYIPTNRTIKSGTVSIQAGRYFVSVLVEEPDNEPQEPQTDGIGIDLGIKEFATLSNGITYRNINKSQQLTKSKVKQLEKKLRCEQRSLSRKYEALKERNKTVKGEATRQNIQKQKLKVQRINYRLTCIRTDYINKVIAETVKTKPEYIAIEDLNVTGMMKNRHLSKAVANQKFSEFRNKLTAKCKENGIELRIVDRWYPSSKTCHDCGCVKSNLTLNDRVFRCECGYEADRDFNAALNLRDTECYKVA